jgi:bifunctional non-homologous end joining protein LigD
LEPRRDLPREHARLALVLGAEDARHDCEHLTARADLDVDRVELPLGDVRVVRHADEDDHFPAVGQAGALLDRSGAKAHGARVAAGIGGDNSRVAAWKTSELAVGGERALRPSRLEMLFWPEERIRKGDLVEYYSRVAPVLLPHVRDRPFTLKRHYNGPRSPFEWIKDAPPEMPDWIAVAPLPAKSRGGELVRYPLVNDEPALLWMVDFGCVDLHVWTSRADDPERPDYVLFDLDPAGVPFADVVRAALLLREALEALGLEAFVRTTGGEGLHVQVPIDRVHTYAEARAFCEIVAGALVRSAHGLVTTERSLARRRGVFVDTKMNGHGQQIVSVYSVRPRPGAPVAAPLRWDELAEDLDPRELTMDVVLERVERDGDLHAPLLASRQRLDAAISAFDR